MVKSLRKLNRSCLLTFGIRQKFGLDRKIFIDKLTYLVLVNDRHLDLISLVDKFQKLTNVFSTNEAHVVALEISSDR